MPVVTPPAVGLMMVILGSILGAWVWVIVRLILRLPVLPPNTPRVVPWGAGSVVAAIVFWLALTASVPLTYRSMVNPQGGGPNADFNPVDQGKVEVKPGEIMTLSAVQNALTLALVPLVLAATAGARPRDFGVVATDLGKQAARGVVAYPLLAPIVFGVMALALRIWGRTPHPLESAIAQDRDPKMIVILVLAGVVLAPAAEELIFRGVLLGWLTRLALGVKKPAKPAAMAEGLAELLPSEPRPDLFETTEIESEEPGPGPPAVATAEQISYNPYAPPAASIAPPVVVESVPDDVRPRALRLVLANVVVSLIFAALHSAVWPTPIPIFFLSIGLGFLYQRTGGILAPMALHIVFNGVSTTMMFLLLGGGGAAGDKPDPKAVAPIPPPAVRVAEASENLPIRPVDGPQSF